MATPFEVAIKKLGELGFFQFVIPYILTSSIFYGLLRKSQIFGPPERNVAVNMTIALVASLMVWASPILLGINMQEQLALFFLQSMIALIIFVSIALVASMFFGPDLADKISKSFGEKSKIWTIFLIAGGIVGISIFVSSGLVNVFFAKGVPSGLATLSEETLTTLVVLILMAVTVVAIVAMK
jgi:hypothetical protein